MVTERTPISLMRALFGLREMLDRHQCSCLSSAMSGGGGYRPSKTCSTVGGISTPVACLRMGSGLSLRIQSRALRDTLCVCVAARWLRSSVAPVQVVGIGKTPPRYITILLSANRHRFHRPKYRSCEDVSG